MKLSAYAKHMGVTYHTAYSWFRNGTIPHPTEQLHTGTIIVHMDLTPKSQDTKVVIYARVYSHDQKADLQRQISRIQDYAAAKGLIVSDVASEIASGMNANRPKLTKLLADPEVTTILVEHKDRLTRFGFELIESSLAAQNRKIVVINETAQEMDQDFIDVITSMCARIYGKRLAKNKVSQIKKALAE